MPLFRGVTALSDTDDAGSARLDVVVEHANLLDEVRDAVDRCALEGVAVVETASKGVPHLLVVSDAEIAVMPDGVCDVLLAPFTDAELALRVRLLRARIRNDQDELHGREALRSAVLQLAERIYQLEEPAEVIALLAREAGQVFGLPAVAIATFGHEQIPAQAARWDEHGVTTPPLDPVVLDALRALVAGPRARDFEEGRVVPLADDGIRSAIAAVLGTGDGDYGFAPMLFRGEPVGVLLTRADSRDWQGNAPALFGYLAARAAHALARIDIDTGRDAAMRELQAVSDELQRMHDNMNDMTTIVRAIADNINVAVMVYDTENRPWLRNSKVEEVLRRTGFDPATGKSKHVYASDRRTRVKEDKNIITETLEGDQRGLVYWVGEPGDQRAVITEAFLVTKESGERLASVVLSYDVTELANAIEIREDYLATVSHELRTPLTSIIGYLDLIEAGYDVDQLGIGAEFSIIQTGAEQLMRLIGDLLTTSAGELSLRVEPVDLTVLLDEHIDAVRPAVEQAGHVLRYHRPDAALRADVDPARVRQVLDNLVSNAIKYTPEGGEITVSLSREGDDAVFRVEDTGTGINPGDMEQIFNRFFRAREAREAAVPGVGIGLTIVKAIVDAHGGSIDVDSEVGRGTVFTVRLPLASNRIVASSALGALAAQPRVAAD